MRAPSPWRVACAVVVMFACATDRTVGPETITSLAVSPDNLEVGVGQSGQLAAVAFDENGIGFVGVPTVWASQDPGVATVSEDGTVAGVAVGTTTVTASAEGFTASAVVVVAPPPVIELSRTAVGFAGVAGGPTPSPDSVLVTNAGGVTLGGLTIDTIIYAGASTGWLTAALDAGVAPTVLRLSAAIAGLPLGSHTATVRLTAPDATNSPQDVAVTLTLGSGPASEIAVSAGDAQSATVNTAVPAAPAVVVRDAFGNPVAGTEVTFAVAGGGGAITGAVDTTGASGIARVGSWTLGTAAGPNQLTATAPGLTGSPVSFTATGVAGAPAQVAAVAGDGQIGTVGQSVPTAPAVRVRDQLNNPVPGVSVTFAVVSGGGSITGAAGTTDAGGIAQVSSWTLGTTAGANSLTATVPGVSGSPVTFAATAIAGAATQVAVSAGNNQTAAVTSSVAVAPSVTVRDQFGNPVAGFGVTFAVGSGGGSITGNVATSDANGVARVGSWTLGTVAGPNTLTATAPGLAGSPVTITATATAGPATQVAISAGNGQTATVNTAVAVPPAVVVRDQFNNPVTGVGVTFAVTSGGGSVAGGNATTSASGVAAPAGWTLGQAAGGNTLTATVPGAGIAGNPVTFTATGTAGPASQVTISAGNNQTATVNTTIAVAPAVVVRDQFNNAVSGVAVTFAVTGGGGAVTGASQTTNAAGLATVGSWRLGTTAGANTLAATVTGLTPATFTATGTAGAATQIAAGAGNDQSAGAGTAVAIAPSAIVRDQFNNPVAGVAVTFAVTGGGGSITGASATTNASGVATVGSWTLGAVAGPNTLTATAPGLTGSPVTFTATGTAGAATQIALNAGNNQAATVNTAVAVAPAVIVRDALNNPVQGVAVTFTVTGGGGSITGASATTNASGVATVGSWTLGTTAGTNNNTLQASSGSLTGSPVTFTASATAGAATQIVLSAGNSQTATVNTAVTTPPSVIVRDQFSNPVSGVVVTFAVTAGGGAVAGGSATTNASGVAAVTSWTLGTVAGTNNNTLQATSGTLTGSPVTFTASATAGAATQMALNAGNNQTATVNTTVATAPSAIVRDQFNNPVAGAAVTFAVTAGGGSVTGGNATSNASGIATVGSWRLGTVAGANSLSATSAGLAGSPVAFSATGTAGAATQISRAAGDGQSATAGTAVAVAPAVLVGDQFNNPVAGVTVNFAVTGGGGSVTGATAVSAANGLATLGSWTLGATPGPNSLSATSSGLAGSPLTFTATGISGSAKNIALSAGNAQTDTVGATLPVAYAVLVTDSAGNPVAGITVAWAVTGGGGSIAPATSLTNASGIATATRTLGTTAGAQTATASVGGLTGSPMQFTATATAGTATQIALNAGNNQTATVNTAVAVAPSVLVRDAFGNPKSGVAVTFAVTAGGGSVAGGNATTNGAGIATVTSWTLGTTAGSSNNALQATSAGLTGSPVAFTASATAGAATQMALNAGNNQTATVNTAVATAPSVIVRDAFGNPKNGVAVTFAVTAGGGSVAGGSATTNASGIAQPTSWTLGTVAGTNNNTLQATSTGLTGSPVTFTASAAAAAASQIALNAGNNQAATVSTTVPTPPSVIVRDQFNNPVGGIAVTFAVTAGGGSVAGGNATTNASGIAQPTSWTLGTTAGTNNNTLQATSSGLAGSPVTFTASATAGAATQIALNAGNNQTATVNNTVATPPSVIVRDQLNNPVAGVAVTFAVTAGGGSVAGGNATTNASGIAQPTSWTLGTVAGTNNNSLQATSGSLAGSPVTFTASATAGAPASLAVNAGNTQTATVNTAVAIAPSVIVRDAFSNPVPGAAVTFAVTGGGGAVAGGNATTNAAGIAAVTSWTLGTTAGTGNNALQATQGALPPVTFTASATAGAATQIAVSAGDNQTATVNTAVATPPSVKVSDQFGNGVSGIAVTFAVGSGGGSLTGGSQITGAGGIATVGSWTLGTGAGTNNNTLQASSGSLTGSPVTFTASATAGAATQIALNAGNGQSATVNTAVTTDPSVLVRDQFNNPVSSVAVNFAVTGGGGSVTGGAQTTNASGIATVTSWTLGTVAGTNTLQATSTGLAGSPVTFTATGTAGAPSATASTIATTSPITACATSCTTGGGTQSIVTVTVRDAFNNAINGASVTWSATGTGNTATNTTGTTDASGMFSTGRLSSTVAQTKTISALINGSVSISPTGSVVVNPDVVSLSNSIVTATSPITASSGASVSTVTVTVRDQFGNGISGRSVTIAVSPVTGNTVTQPAAVTNASGVTTGSFFTTRAETKTVTASVTGVGTISPDNALVTVNAASPASIVVNAGDNQTARVATAVATAPSVLVRDAFLNPVPNVTVTFSAATGGGSVAGGTPSTNASGIAAVTSWTLGSTSADAANGTMANSLSASATGAGSTTFNASAIYILSGDVQPIYNASCALAGCHVLGATPPNLATGSSRGSTLGVASTCTVGTRVVAGSAATSVLYLRVSTATTCGSAMPPSTSVTMSAANQKIIRAWINNGAQNN